MADKTALPAAEAQTIEVPRSLQTSTLKAGGGVRGIVPQNVDEAWRIATIITASGMAPKSYNIKNSEKTDVNAVMVGIMHGMEVGLTPMAALQSIAVINGMPTIWGDGALGLVRASGLLESFEEGIDGEGDNRVAWCETKRVGEAQAYRSTFSVEQAKKAGLWGNPAKANTWGKYEERMLQMRTRSFRLRDGFADILRGMHVREEVMDMTPGQDGTYEVVEVRPSAAQSLPPKPRREEPQTIASEEVEQDTTGKGYNELYDFVGDTLGTYDDPADWVKFFIEGCELHITSAELDQYKENNETVLKSFKGSMEFHACTLALQDRWDILNPQPEESQGEAATEPVKEPAKATKKARAANPPLVMLEMQGDMPKWGIYRNDFRAALIAWLDSGGALKPMLTANKVQLDAMQEADPNTFMDLQDDITAAVEVSSEKLL